MKAFQFLKANCLTTNQQTSKRFISVEGSTLQMTSLCLNVACFFNIKQHCVIDKKNNTQNSKEPILIYNNPQGMEAKNKTVKNNTHT